MQKFRLSIVIPCFNKWNFTKSCLTDLNHLPEDHEIILIDDCSSDQTSQEISNFPRVRYYRNDTNLGFSKSCNRGFSESYGNNIMFLNNDIRVKSNHNNWTEEIIELCKGNCLVGPTGGYIDPQNDFRFVYETSDPAKKINYMSGWCLSASRHTWSKLNIPKSGTFVGNPPAQIFNEKYGKAYFEDTDVSVYATTLGIEFKLVKIPVVHFGKQSTSQLNTHKLYEEARKIFVQTWKNKIK